MNFTSTLKSIWGKREDKPPLRLKLNPPKISSKEPYPTKVKLFSNHLKVITLNVVSAWIGVLLQINDPVGR